MTTFSLASFMRPTQVREVAPRPLRAASFPERFAQAPPPMAPAGVLQPFGGSRQNSRGATSLGNPLEQTWERRFATPLRPDTLPHSVLVHGDVALVQAPVWHLLGLDGRLREVGRSGSSPLVIAPDAGAFCWADGDGMLVGAPLATGYTEWSYGLCFGDGAVYPYVGVHGRRVVVIGGERNTNPEADPMPQMRLGLEVIDLGDPITASRAGLLTSAKSAGALMTASYGDVLGAMDDARVVVTWHGHLLVASLDLEVQQLVVGAFAPRAVSLGEAGRAYLIVLTEQGMRLWMINAEGELAFSTALPDEAGDTLVPPIVTADHRVFVVTRTRILAFSPKGDFVWEFAPSRGAPRAMATADGWMLVTVDDTIGVLDEWGRAASLVRLPGEVFATAPALSAQGEILAATQSLVVCFAPQTDLFESTFIR